MWNGSPRGGVAQTQAGATAEVPARLISGACLWIKPLGEAAVLGVHGTDVAPGMLGMAGVGCEASLTSRSGCGLWHRIQEPSEC